MGKKIIKNSLRRVFNKKAKLYADKYSDRYLENIKIKLAYEDGAKGMEKYIKENYILIIRENEINRD